MSGSQHFTVCFKLPLIHLAITPNIYNPFLRYQMGDSGVRSHINMESDHMFPALLVRRDDTSRGEG